jgi:hypothetical protein
MGKETLILIHGTGDMAPGKTLLETTRGLSGLTGTRDDNLAIDGVLYARLRSDHPEFDEVIEVNWSDLRRPGPNKQLVGYWFSILVAMLAIGDLPAPEYSPVERVRLWLARQYRRSIEALLVYCIFPPLVSLLWVATDNTVFRCALGLLAGVAVLGLTFWLSRLGKWFHAGWLWGFGIAGATIAFAMGAVSAAGMVTVAARIYVLAQIASGVLLVSLLLVTCASRGAPAEWRSSRCAAAYFPFFILSSIGALLWAVVLAAVYGLSERREAFAQWQDWYLSALSSMGYELTFALLVFLTGVVAVVVAISYWRRAGRPVQQGSKTAGLFARDGLHFTLTAGAVGCVMWVLVYAVAKECEWLTGWNWSVFEVYAVSSGRIVSFLPVVAGPLALVADVVIDVIFYVTPHAGLNTASVLRRRLHKVIGWVRRENSERPITLVAHSQGSVIAVDVIGRPKQFPLGDTEIRLITMGSPIAALHERFLCSSPESRASDDMQSFVVPGDWRNAWREGDYIGGPMPRWTHVVDVRLGPGGHTGYWGDSKFWCKVLGNLRTEAEAVAPPRP